MLLTVRLIQRQDKELVEGDESDAVVAALAGEKGHALAQGLIGGAGSATTQYERSQAVNLKYRGCPPSEDADKSIIVRPQHHLGRRPSLKEA